MKNIVVCYKWLRDEADIRVDERTRELDLEKAKYKLNEYDRNAIEAGVQIKNATGGNLVGVTFGPNAGQSAKDALSRGLDSVVYVDAGAALADADSRTTAAVLVALVRRLGEVEAVLCSEGSSDEYAQQTGARLAAMLGFPSVSFVSSLAPEGGAYKLGRKLDDGVEHVETAGPVVISVTPDVNTPPIPSVKQILGAKKKPATEVKVGDLGLSEAEYAPQFVTVDVLAPVAERKRLRMNPEGVSLADAAASLVKRLAADGVL